MESICFTEVWAHGPVDMARYNARKAGQSGECVPFSLRFKGHQGLITFPLPCDFRELSLICHTEGVSGLMILNFFSMFRLSYKLKSQSEMFLLDHGKVVMEDIKLHSSTKNDGMRPFTNKTEWIAYENNTVRKLTLLYRVQHNIIFGNSIQCVQFTFKVLKD